MLQAQPHGALGVVVEQEGHHRAAEDAHLAGQRLPQHALANQSVGKQREIALGIAQDRRLALEAVHRVGLVEAHPAQLVDQLFELLAFVPGEVAGQVGQALADGQQIPHTLAAAVEVAVQVVAAGQDRGVQFGVQLLQVQQLPGVVLVLLDGDAVGAEKQPDQRGADQQHQQQGAGGTSPVDGEEGGLFHGWWWAASCAAGSSPVRVSRKATIRWISSSVRRRPSW